ncbi:hypothetical protein ACJJTC_010478 [Scirpophaga incertulas]
MPRTFQTVSIFMYVILIVLFIRSLVVNRNVEVIEIEYLLRRPSAKIQRELMIQKRVVSIFSMKKKLKRLPTDYKYILKWTKAFSHYSSLIYKNGQQVFLDNNCTFNNCYLTNNKGILMDVTFFDAILFDVENNWDSHPLERSQYQRFIFVATESAHNFPICSNLFEDYYNLTWTYKLDSDIKNTYLTITDKNGTVVGPKRDMQWIEADENIPEDVKQKIKYKKKAAAWFVSNCNAKSKRRIIADAIKIELLKYNLDIDIYGYCGQMICPRDQFQECLKIIEEEYYFYLSFENSLAEDYVTEKILHALMYYTVPIVYGGANYSRFLPPGSYINAKELQAEEVAKLMNKAITNSNIYETYFRWHNHYSYREAYEGTNVCELCKILNSPPTFTAKVNFRKWWNEATCKK